VGRGNELFNQSPFSSVLKRPVIKSTLNRKAGKRKVEGGGGGVLVILGGGRFSTKCACSTGPTSSKISEACVHLSEMQEIKGRETEG